MVSSSEVEQEAAGPDRDRRPATPEAGGRRFWFALAAIALVAAIWRFAYTYAYRQAAVLSDGLHYAQGARFLADGRGFINPLGMMMNGVPVNDAVHPPAWTSVLAVSALTGHETSLDFRYVAAVVGVATVVMTGLAARAAFGNRVGLIAAGLAAAYPNIWLYEHELVSEPLALLGVATLLWCTFRFRTRPSLGWAIGLGVVVAVSALTRAELIFMALLIVVPTVLLARQFTWGRRIGLLAASAAAALVLIGPWFAYNTTRFTEPVPLSAGLGGAMSAGNCETTYDPSNERFAYYHFGCVIYSGTKLSAEPSEADVQLRQSSLHFISEHKAAFVVTASARIGRAFSFYAPFQQVGFEGERGTTPWVITAGLFSYWLLLPLAVYGAVVARRRRVPIYPFVALVGVAAFSVVLTIGAVRYRAPVEIPLVMLAAVGMDALLRALVGRRSSEAPDASPSAGASDPSPGPSEGATRANGSGDRDPRRDAPAEARPVTTGARGGSHRFP